VNQIFLFSNLICNELRVITTEYNHKIGMFATANQILGQMATENRDNPGQTDKIAKDLTSAVTTLQSKLQSVRTPRLGSIANFTQFYIHCEEIFS
jgi:hypothetical protein